MKKKLSNYLMAAGGVMFLAALLLFGFNEYDAYKADQNGKMVVKKIQKEIRKNSSAFKGTESELVEKEIDGHFYIGYLVLPSLGLELPVMSNWDYPSLRISPCRQYGSTKNNNLVIAGHNYPGHFGRISNLQPGEQIQFTDMEGRSWFYEIGILQVISPDSVEKVKESPWDLVLYTCTYGGKNRVMVGAKRN